MKTNSENDIEFCIFVIKLSYSNKMARNLCDLCLFLKGRVYLISWISLVLYLFYKSFIYYLHGHQFFYLRRMLGLGLCVSRGTASVLNICCALVLLPLCKKLNQLLYRVLSKLCPGVFFFWLESAKSFHMTVAVTLVTFGVIHSVSHFVNLWNFSRSYDEQWPEINLARYKNESPFLLLISIAGVTGVSMLLIVLSMGLTSTRIVRRRVYNAFWYTHQLYLPFMLLLMIHPLSGVLKEEILDENKNDTNEINSWTNRSISDPPKFAAIQSTTWLWMAVPLICFFLDMLWRIFSRNLAKVRILHVTHMPGRTISLSLSCPFDDFVCRMGQYVLIQCSELSVMEWHPFTVVEVPKKPQRKFVIWIKAKGDWTKGLEKMLKERGPNNLNILIDGPFSSPMQGITKCDIAICIAAGVGITPFVSILRDMLINPRNRLPGRIHLIWIVRHENELTWIASLATEAILQLRNANRPDRLHLELYVTNSKENDFQSDANKEQNSITHMVVLNEKGGLTHLIGDDERKTLLTPNKKRDGCIFEENEKDNVDNKFDFNIAKKYPLIGCRVRRGRPHWDQVFGYWAHLYPEHHLNLYCCGPKKLVKLLRSKCKYTSRFTNTKLTFIHEAFS